MKRIKQSDFEKNYFLCIKKGLFTMKRLLLLMIVFFGGIVQVVAENTLFYDSKQLTCDLITSICQDKDGFIWIGTDYGLNKFNGIQFTHYYNNPKDSTSLSDNSVKAPVSYTHLSFFYSNRIILRNCPTRQLRRHLQRLNK